MNNGICSTALTKLLFKSTYIARGQDHGFKSNNPYIKQGSSWSQCLKVNVISVCPVQSKVVESKGCINKMFNQISMAFREGLEVVLPVYCAKSKKHLGDYVWSKCNNSNSWVYQYFLSVI